jgi:FkbM family methyltransferase
VSTIIEPLRAGLSSARLQMPDYRRAGEISDFLVLVASKKPQDDNAERCYRWALDLEPENARAWNALGRIHLERKRWREAYNAFRLALAAEPRAAFCVNAAHAATELGETDEALALCHQALELDRCFIPAFIQMTAIELRLDRHDDALETIEAALIIDPKCHELLFARSEIELARGDFENGWRDYEHRPARLDLAAKLDELPEWKGEPLDGKTILVVADQGLGDQIMFSRCLWHPQFNVAKVVLFAKCCDMATLFDARMADRVITSNAEADPISFDYWIELASLPQYCCTYDVASLGRYLKAPDDGRWKARVPENGRLKVGVCWAGNPKYARDAGRSLHFSQIAPILDVPGVDFYLLQAGVPAEQAADSKVPNLAEHTHDVADLAAAIERLDLVITTCTMPAHLAGALGKPVWVMLQAKPYWAWGETGMSSPLYGSAQLFRQKESGDWATVIDWVRLALTNARDRHQAEPEPKPDPVPPLVAANTRYGRMTFHRSDHYIGRSLALYGEYSESEAALLRALLKPRDTVIEAGANIGALTVAISDMVGPDGAVLAFEPQLAYSRLLDWNTANRANVTAIRRVLGNGRSRELVEVPSAETDKVSAPGWKVTGDTELVAQQNIDELGVAPALIKVDVDGQELEILEGAERTIAKARPFLYVEYDKPECYPDLIPWVHARGYRIYQHFAPLFNPANFAGNRINVFGKIVSAMLVCIPEERFMPEDFARRFSLERVRLTERR